MEKYHNLTQMLACNYSAHAYFSDLPPHVQKIIAAQGRFIHSPNELQGYAQKLMHDSAE